MLSIWLNNRCTHALFWLFPICSAIFYCQHVIYMRTVWIIRYMLCICSACGLDMGKHVYIPATYIRSLPTDLVAIWNLICVFGIYHSFIYAICFPYGSTIDERMHCSDCFQYVVQYFIANMWSRWRLYWLFRYMLCICSACGQDMGERVCIPATYIQTLSNDLAAIWKPYECLLHIIYSYLLYAFHMAQQ